MYTALFTVTEEVCVTVPLNVLAPLNVWFAVKDAMFAGFGAVPHVGTVFAPALKSTWFKVPALFPGINAPANTTFPF